MRTTKRISMRVKLSFLTGLLGCSAGVVVLEKLAPRMSMTEVRLFGGVVLPFVLGFAFLLISGLQAVRDRIEVLEKRLREADGNPRQIHS
jgi:hypothetical protein